MLWLPRDLSTIRRGVAITSRGLFFAVRLSQLSVVARDKSIGRKLKKTGSQSTGNPDRCAGRLEMHRYNKAKSSRRRSRTAERCDAPRFWWGGEQPSRSQDSRDRCSLFSPCPAAHPIYIVPPPLVFGV